MAGLIMPLPVGGSGYSRKVPVAEMAARGVGCVPGPGVPVEPPGDDAMELSVQAAASNGRSAKQQRSNPRLNIIFPSRWCVCPAIHMQPHIVLLPQAQIDSF